MPSPALIIFLLAYTGIALGRVPGLTLDRTGIALLGAVAMVVCGAVSLEQAASAIDFPTVLLLYALMIISAQLRLGGFYTRVALRLGAFGGRPRLFLLMIMAASALLSSVLANDIVCLAFTPVLTVTLLKSGFNPLPFLLGLATASNIGSAATIIGNPQNMLIGQVGRLEFADFTVWCVVPAIFSLAAGYLILCRQYANTFYAGCQSAHDSTGADWPEFNRWQSIKGLTAVVILILLFFTRIPREISAISVTGVLLCSRKMKSRQMLELVDWHLITLFCALFIIIGGLSLSGMPTHMMAFLYRHHLNPQNLFALTGISALLSNLVSNVPAAMLLIRFLGESGPAAWYTLAVSSTFAGNLLILGSIANLIVIEQAKVFGIDIGFKQHAKTGIPVTLCSLAILVIWIWIFNVNG